MRPPTLLLAALAALAAAGPGATQPAPAAQASAASVGASLNITPKRLTLDRGHRNGTVFILNQGTAPVTVDISMVDRIMLRDGQILSVDEAAKVDEGKVAAGQLKSAREALQISPRRVTLTPGKGQTIRLRLTSLPEGGPEYRSHLTVTTLPPRETGATAEAAASGATGNELRFQITAVYGLSIPVIVRTADADARAQLLNARVEYPEISTDGRSPPRRTPVLAVELVRAGASSLYGNFEVRTAGQARAEPIGLARGVGLYPEIDRRVVRIPLSRAPREGEKLEVTFTDDDTSPGKVLAKVSL